MSGGLLSRNLAGESALREKLARLADGISSGALTADELARLDGPPPGGFAEIPAPGDTRLMGAVAPDGVPHVRRRELAS